MRIPLLLLFLFSVSLLQAQTFSISGKVVDAKDNAALTGAHISLLHPWGEAYKTAVTQADGTFEIKDLSKGGYAFQISYIGFTDYQADGGNKISHPVFVRLLTVGLPG